MIYHYEHISFHNQVHRPLQKKVFNNEYKEYSKNPGILWLSIMVTILIVIYYDLNSYCYILWFLTYVKFKVVCRNEVFLIPCKYFNCACLHVCPVNKKKTNLLTTRSMEDTLVPGTVHSLMFGIKNFLGQYLNNTEDHQWFFKNL